MQQPARPILLYNDECAVCRRIAAWVRASDRGAAALDVRPIGDDPATIAQLHPGLDIWDAYEVIHLLMPDGSMRTGGWAVAQVLRALPNTKWLASILDLHIAGFRPGALLVNAGYAVLAELRPLLGCESCGSTNALVGSVQRAIRWLNQWARTARIAGVPHHASALRAARRRRRLVRLMPPGQAGRLR
jgi:predicted DCC family thiol-disulfide oxidoreductase YuxK